MKENTPQEDPKHLGEFLTEHVDEVVNFEGDPDREAATKARDLLDEGKDIQERISELREEIQSGRADEGALERLEALKRDAVATDADRYEVERHKGAKPPQ